LLTCSEYFSGARKDNTATVAINRYVVETRHHFTADINSKQLLIIHCKSEQRCILLYEVITKTKFNQKLMTPNKVTFTAKSSQNVYSTFTSRMSYSLHYVFPVDSSQHGKQILTVP